MSGTGRAGDVRQCAPDDQPADRPGRDAEHLDAALCDPARIRALADTGLSAAADPALERIAERVRRRLDVPIALVSLVAPDRQDFPGMAGLPEPWASKRSTPLSHSFCQYVVADGEPLIVEDAREHALLRDSAAIPDLDVIAYAGMPLIDGDGNVLGSLCAIDTRPRRWTTTQLDALRDLTDGCTAELRLRLARHDAEQERLRRDAVEEAVRHSLGRSETLLLASEAFTDTTTVADVEAQVRELVTRHFDPAYVGLALLDESGRRLHRLHAERFPSDAEDLRPWVDFAVTERLPSATAVRTNRMIRYTDRESFDADHPAAARRLLRGLDLHACVAVPLPGPHGRLGALVLGWDAPRPFPPDDLIVITTIAGYTAQALDRARQLAHRTDAAYVLQHAMLTTLPAVEGAELAARYLPADAREQVGGDWYDAIRLHDPVHPQRETIAITVGDVVGHALHAATIMGQARSMLRQAACDHPAGPPSLIFTAFERASRSVGLDATGTALFALLTRDPGENWAVHWTNAGHPPPVLIHPDGRTELLGGHDIMFGYLHLTGSGRADHRREVPPGATLFAYTDGLVERRGHDIDTGIDALLELLARTHRLGTDEIVETTTRTLTAEGDDDVVVFAVRL